MSEQITASPLCWPDGWKRTKRPERSRFGRYNSKVSISKATWFVLDELRRMGIPDFNVIISTDLKLRQDGLPYSNQREPEEQGVSVWWKDGGRQKVIALDKYDRIADNLYAIGKTIEAMRGIERWGSGEILERTFTGFTALPPAGRPWRQVLGYPEGNDLTEVKRLYRKAMTVQHPDHGGDPQLASEINAAWEQARQELS